MEELCTERYTVVLVMARKSKQFNYYVNPEEEKELFDFLEAFPKMTRSSYIKRLILSDLGKGDSFIPEPQKKPLRSEAHSFEIDIEDI